MFAQALVAGALARYAADKLIKSGAHGGGGGSGGGDADYEYDAEAAMEHVRGATAMLQRLSGAGALPPAAAAALRAAHDSAVAQGELWAGAYTRPLLSST